MTRTADSRSGKCLAIWANTSAEEEKIKTFKELHARNPELQIRTTILEAIDHFLAKHNYPPGNSQTLLFHESLKQCYSCKKFLPNLRKVKFVSGLIAEVCSLCIEKDRNEKGLIKKVF